MNEITIGDKIYISSKRAAEITGYAKDYVGQLCREGHVEAKMVGRGWYVYEPSIRAHRFGEEVVHEENGDTAAENEQNEEISNDSANDESVESAVDCEPYEPARYSSENTDVLPGLEPSSPDLDELLKEPESLTDMQSAWKEWFERRQADIQEAQVTNKDEIQDEKAEDDEEDDSHHEQTEDEEATEIYDLPGLVDRQEEEIHEVVDDIKPERALEPVQGAYASENVSIPLHKLATAQEQEYETYEPTVENNVPINVKRVEEDSVYVPMQRIQAIPQRRVVVTQRKLNKASKTRNSRLSNSNAPVVALLIALSLLTIVITIIGSGLADTYIKTFIGNNRIVNFILGSEIVNK